MDKYYFTLCKYGNWLLILSIICFMSVVFALINGVDYFSKKKSIRFKLDLLLWFLCFHICLFFINNYSLCDLQFFLSL